MKPPFKKIYITPETHWDREWYLPFEGYRMKLVRMMDELLDLIKNNPNYANFTFDGQSVVIQDYLEVRPEREDELKKAAKSGKISFGPMYILPDEYLVSGEAMVRNGMLGIRLTKKYGHPLNCAYIPDPFGHLAQLPQIMAGFELPLGMFARGLGNEFEEQNLDLEFLWKAPGDAAEMIAVHLIEGYGSVAHLSDQISEKGIYKEALRRIGQVATRLGELSATGIIVLHNGTDHLFAQPHIPDVVKQWNQMKNEEIGPLIQAHRHRRDRLVSPC